MVSQVPVWYNFRACLWGTACFTKFRLWGFKRKEICLCNFLIKLGMISLLRVDGQAAVTKHLPSMKEALAWSPGGGGVETGSYLCTATFPWWFLVCCSTKKSESHFYRHCVKNWTCARKFQNWSCTWNPSREVRFFLSGNSWLHFDSDITLRQGAILN